MAIENPDINAKSWERILESNSYRMESISAALNISKKILEESIASNSNQLYWEVEYYERKSDFRNPKNKVAKNDIFKFFNSNHDKSYYEYLKK